MRFIRRGVRHKYYHHDDPSHLLKIEHYSLLCCTTIITYYTLQAYSQIAAFILSLFTCVRRRTSTHARRGRRRCTSTRVNQCTATYGTVRAKLYAICRCCQWAQLRCRPSPYGDAAVEINVLDYNVAVRQQCLQNTADIAHETVNIGKYAIIIEHISIRSRY